MIDQETYNLANEVISSGTLAMGLTTDVSPLTKAFGDLMVNISVSGLHSFAGHGHYFGPGVFEKACKEFNDSCRVSGQGIGGFVPPNMHVSLGNPMYRSAGYTLSSRYIMPQEFDDVVIADLDLRAVMQREMRKKVTQSINESFLGRMPLTAMQAEQRVYDEPSEAALDAVRAKLDEQNSSITLETFQKAKILWGVQGRVSINGADVEFHRGSNWGTDLGYE
jgi:hypothetical protein